MANYSFKPGEEHRERIISLFQELTKKKTGINPGTSRGEIEKEIRSNPGKYPELNALTDAYLKTCLTKILNTDPRACVNPVWRKVWMIPEASV
jgi:hypothetical protein